ncbi:MAG TPA: hypothetical protein PK385_11920 [Spirochaetota bacterium]|nr:hypothetical protein [Spirochaetota bacterium]HOS33666.1 hypothetical protein [Spirochaetota bacterium]HOS56750.1 hypothetical protein [Spirochaetota bacterium]HPK62326.1 hypothetical protein [Spirochaetota bacterium]HQF77903.1 hypothetical protein [Spirochaetota bacterium]
MLKKLLFSAVSALILIGCSQPKTYKYSETIYRTFPTDATVDNIDDISVENSAGDIEIKGWDNTNVEIAIEKKTDMFEDELLKVKGEITIEDHTLKIKTVYFKTLGEPKVSVKYVIKTPKNIVVRRAEVFTGNILIEDVSVDLIKSEAGSITLNRVGYVNSISGTTNVININTAERVKSVSNINGFISLKGVKRFGIIKNISGNIEAEILDDAICKNIDSLTGNVDLKIKDGLNLNLNLKTSTGIIDNEFDSNIIGSGAAGLCVEVTAGGAISIRKI